MRACQCCGGAIQKKDYLDKVNAATRNRRHCDGCRIAGCDRHNRPGKCCPIHQRRSA